MKFVPNAILFTQDSRRQLKPVDVSISSIKNTVLINNKTGRKAEVNISAFVFYSEENPDVKRK